MSGGNVEVIRRMFEAFRRRDAVASNEALADDIEWDMTRIAATVPDIAGVYRGAEQSTALWTAWLAPWSRLEFDYDLRQAGDTVVALVRNQRQWGRHSGVVTEIPDYAWLYRLRAGKVVLGRWFPDHRSALEAAGLSG